MQEHLGTTRQWPQRKPDGTTEPKRRWTPAWVIVTGAIAAIAGYTLGQTTILVGYTGGRTVSQVNGICTSALGQLGQAISVKASQGCGRVAAYEQVHGWLIILGVITVAAGIAWSLRIRHRGAT